MLLLYQSSQFELRDIYAPVTTITKQLVQFTVECGKKAISLSLFTELFLHDIVNHLPNEDVYIQYDRYSTPVSEKDIAQARAASVSPSPAVPESHPCSSRDKKRETFGNYKNKDRLRKTVFSESLKQFLPLEAQTKQDSTPWMDTQEVTKNM